MHRINARWLLFPVLALAAVPAVADNLSEPPQAWRGRVESVAEVPVPSADAAVHRALVGGRRDLDVLLEREPQADAEAVGDAYGRLGALYHVHAVAAAAELCYRNAIRLSPRNFRWRYYAGELLRDRGRYREALVEFAAAEALDADYPPLRLRMAQAWLELGDTERAGATLQSLRREPGLEAAANHGLGRIALLRKDPAPAVEYFQAALRHDPEASRVHYPLAQALRALGRDEEARIQLARHGNREPMAEDRLGDELAALRSGPGFRFMQALQSVRSGDYDAAVRGFEQGLAQDPHNMRARVSYARVLYLSGDAAGSRQELERALRERSDYSLAGFLRGLLDEESGKREAAEERYRQVLAIDPGHSGARLYLAGLLFRAGRHGEAAALYAEADPDIPFAPLLRIVAAGRAGAPQGESARALTELARSRPDDPMPRYALARLLALSPDSGVRDPERALQLARDLQNLHPAPPFTALGALVLAANGDLEQAEAQVRQLEFMPPWMSGLDLAALRSEMETLEGGGLPPSVWPADDPLLQPPPTGAGGVMRDYPVETPY
jgi:tetratricopeptide (TPR) repeat protein